MAKIFIFLAIMTIFTGCIGEEFAVEKPAKAEAINEAINNEINHNVVENLQLADNVVLSQGYEPDLQLILNQEQIYSLAKKLEAVKPMRTPEIYGSGYPAYEITVYKDSNVLLTIKIEDPVTIQVLSDSDSYYEYFKQDGALWDMAKEWLPMKETQPGTIEHLYKANKVEINVFENEECTLIEYNLEKQPSFSFRITAIVSILSSAKIKEKMEPIDTGTHYMTIVFNFENHKETVEIYEDYALFEGKFLEMKSISESMSYILQDGRGAG